jgi:ornithine decarboxylase
MNEEDQLANLSSFLKENEVLLVEKNLEPDNLITKIIEKNAPTGSFYIINLGDIINKVNLWNELFQGIDIRYAVKSNPNEVICKLLPTLGVGFDIASVNELNIVKGLTEPSKIIYANPVKEPSSISYARSLDVDLLVVDSENELYKNKLFHPHADILIRLKVDDSESLCKFSDKFGIDKEDIPGILKLGHSMDLRIIGVCFHIGSMCKNPEQYYKALELVAYTFNVAKEIGFIFNTIDIGGGMPGSSSESDLAVLKEISKSVKKGLKTFFEVDLDSDPVHDHIKEHDLKLLAEPGRFIVASSHILVVNVIGKKVKINKGLEKTFIYTLNDGIYGSFNCITYDHQNPVIFPYNNRDTKKYESIIFGNTCDSVDKITSSVMLPELEVGDLCYILDFGAYTRASSSSFNGFGVVRSYYVLS